jgi:hypothetical protein
MLVKHLQVKLRDGVTPITVLFEKNVPDTVVQCGVAAMLGWKASKAGQWVTTANGKREYSRTWYQVPLFTMEGYVRLTGAHGVLSIAHIETGRTIKGASGDLPDMEKGTTKVICEWEHVDMVIGHPPDFQQPQGFYQGPDFQQPQGFLPSA